MLAGPLPALPHYMWISDKASAGLQRITLIDVISSQAGQMLAVTQLYSKHNPVKKKIK